MIPLSAQGMADAEAARVAGIDACKGKKKDRREAANMAEEQARGAMYGADGEPGEDASKAYQDLGAHEGPGHLMQPGPDQRRRVPAAPRQRRAPGGKPRARAAPGDAPCRTGGRAGDGCAPACGPDRQRRARRGNHPARPGWAMGGEHPMTETTAAPLSETGYCGQCGEPGVLQGRWPCATAARSTTRSSRWPSALHVTILNVMRGKDRHEAVQGPERGRGGRRGQAGRGPGSSPGHGSRRTRGHCGGTRAPTTGPGRPPSITASGHGNWDAPRTARTPRPRRWRRRGSGGHAAQIAAERTGEHEKAASAAQTPRQGWPDAPSARRPAGRRRRRRAAGRGQPARRGAGVGPDGVRGVPVRASPGLSTSTTTRTWPPRRCAARWTSPPRSPGLDDHVPQPGPQGRPRGGEGKPPAGRAWPPTPMAT